MENSATLPLIENKTPTPSSTVAVPRVYFKNLDGIRFFAALMVMLQHLSDYKGNPGVDLSNVEKGMVSSLGSHGVTLFFVLSGFLIFSLLFVEKQYTHTIQIKSFYVRRILRIWPLYFGFGLLSILGIDYVFKMLGLSIDTPASINLIYLFTFSINLQLIFATINKGIIELYWSVCIEEQFYLMAPWLVKKANNFLGISLGLIAIGIGSKFLLDYLITSGTIHTNNHINPLYTFTTCWFDAFGMGILAAYFNFNKNIYGKIKGVVENKLIQAIVIFLAFLYVTNVLPKAQIIDKYFFSTVASVLFAYIILAASTGNFIFNFENSFLRRMGRYSYGMYVWHSSIIQVLLLLLMRWFTRDNRIVFEILYPLLSVTIVVIVAGLSYELYEKHFLKLKKAFTVVQNQKV
jgi:peptidoglycan/LPS O-acetylase OafA/YrhL